MQFAVGDEPLWVGRGGRVGPLLYARVDVEALTDHQRGELSTWLAAFGVVDATGDVVVCRTGDGFEVRTTSDGQPVVVACDLKTAPGWLRAPG